MRLDRIAGVALLAASAYFGSDILVPSGRPWPRYAAPQTHCTQPLAAAHDGLAIRLRHPAGWRILERMDERSGVAQIFLTPQDGAPSDVTVFLREIGRVSTAITAPSPNAKSEKKELRDAPASSTPASMADGPSDAAGPPPSNRLQGTEQGFEIDGHRRGTAYLTSSEGTRHQLAYSWMVFVWDDAGRVVAISGPKLKRTQWPGERRRNERLNCAFWEIVRTVEPK